MANFINYRVVSPFKYFVLFNASIKNQRIVGMRCIEVEQITEYFFNLKMQNDKKISIHLN